MSEKYIDLATRISDDLEPTMVGEAYIRNSLRWLDEHPDRVPGRTMTRSEIDNHIAIDITMRNGFILGFEAAGGRVIPDPDPETTNAEKLKAVLDAIGDSTGGYREHLASRLDKAGVKAPGGDDDH